MLNPRIVLVRRLLDQAFDRRSWHGPNLLGSLRGTPAEEAAWRPGPARHNAWELAVHAAYWKYRVYLRLTDEPPRTFDLKGSDWFARPGGDEAAWKNDLALLKTWHDRLCHAVEGFDPAALDQPSGVDTFTYFDLIAGAAAHDVYHAGQIRLLKRMRAA